MKNKNKGISSVGLAMMALGCVIGGSFFLGSSIAIRSAGPAIIISFIIGGGIVYIILFALSEMTVADATAGSFRTYAERAYGPMIGFLVGWIYWTGLVLTMSSEAVAVSILINSWIPQISIPVLGSFIIIGIIVLNLLGADRLSKLESSLVAVKLFAIVTFIIAAAILVFGLLPGKPAVGLGILKNEPFSPGGLAGIAGSLLIVMFTYAGFEIIGLAASESENPDRTIPRAIVYTVVSLAILYISAISLILLLIPTSSIPENTSPMVAALLSQGLPWAAGLINIVLVTAILSTMLAAAFGLGRMMRSLADDGHAPPWLKDKQNIPYRGIIFTGIVMLFAFGLSFILPKDIYLFLASSGGFSLLFAYLAILITHNKFRREHGCPPKGKCQLPGYPFTSWLAIVAILAIMASMPLIPRQGSGLLAGILLIMFYIVCYMVFKSRELHRH